MRFWALLCMTVVPAGVGPKMESSLPTALTGVLTGRDGAEVMSAD